jgi:hypothetical protein
MTRHVELVAEMLTHEPSIITQALVHPRDAEFAGNPHIPIGIERRAPIQIAWPT